MWTKLCDSYTDHPKLHLASEYLAASLSARREALANCSKTVANDVANDVANCSKALANDVANGDVLLPFTTNIIAGCYSRCLAWCSRHLTGGTIPLGMLLSIAVSRDVISAMTRARLIDVADDGTLSIHDYAVYNKSRKSQAKGGSVSEARAEAGRRGGRARAAALASPSTAEEVALEANNVANCSKPVAKLVAKLVANPSKTVANDVANCGKHGTGTGTGTGTNMKEEETEKSTPYDVDKDKDIPLQRDILPPARTRDSGQDDAMPGQDDDDGGYAAALANDRWAPLPTGPYVSHLPDEPPPQKRAIRHSKEQIKTFALPDDDACF